jgi:hypothetical protein
MALLRREAMLLVECELFAQRAHAHGVGSMVEQHDGPFPQNRMIGPYNAGPAMGTSSIGFRMHTRQKPGATSPAPRYLTLMPRPLW